jgi:hypothetical protein
MRNSFLTTAVAILLGPRNIRPDDSCAPSANFSACPAVSAQTESAARTSHARAESAPAGHGFPRHQVGGVSARSAGSWSHVRNTAGSI